MTESSDTLTNRQQLAIAEILTSRSLEEACRRLRASKTTVYAWFKQPAFQAELKRQRQALVQQAYDRLGAAMSQAVDKLLELLHAGANQNIQLRAAQTLLDHGARAVEAQDLEQRLEALERTGKTTP